MSEKNCKVKQGENVKRFSWKTEKLQHSDDEVLLVVDNENKDWKGHILNIVELLNEQQELIEELQVSDEMGWKRAEHFEKKCPKELHNKKMYIKRLEYKVQKLKEENELLKKDNQRQKTLRNKHWREIQARANGYNRIISSLENRIPHHIVEELRNAPLLDCDYEGVESNE